MAILNIKKGNEWQTIAAMQGPVGKSAFDYAKAGGYPFTEEQFTQDLVKIHHDYIIWIGTQSEYDALSMHDLNTLYFIKEG